MIVYVKTKFAPGCKMTVVQWGKKVKLLVKKNIENIHVLRLAIRLWNNLCLLCYSQWTRRWTFFNYWKQWIHSPSLALQPHIIAVLNLDQEPITREAQHPSEKYYPKNLTRSGLDCNRHVLQ